MKHKKIIAIMLSMAIACGLTSCKKDEPESEVVSTTTTTEGSEIPDETIPEEQEEVEEIDELYDPNNPMAVNPITGVQDMDPENEGMRSVSVVINNCLNAMPQRGICSADTIYEYETEGGQTRLLAQFADVNTIPEIGSLRSARIVAADLACGNNSIFIHYGRNARVPDEIYTWGISHIDGNECSAGSNNVRTAENGYLNLPEGLYFWRDSIWLSQRALEHTAVSDGIHIAEGIEHFGIDIEGYTPRLFNFVAHDSVDLEDAEECRRINVYFSATNDDALFVYDEETGLYYKSQYGNPQIDLNIREQNEAAIEEANNAGVDIDELDLPSEQIAVENVIIIFANICGHGDTTVDVHFESAGTGWYISEGRMTPISWLKETPASQLTLYNADGEELEVNRGKSYVCIVDWDYINYSQYSADLEGDMQYLYFTPELDASITRPEEAVVH